MRIISFNVNSVRVRLPHLAALINKYQPDILGLQETKVQDGDFPEEEIRQLGYEAAFYGQKTHYGVALLSRIAPLDVVKGYAHDDESSQRRFISADFSLNSGETLTVINGYFPQGESRSHSEKFSAKQKFYADLVSHLAEFHSPDNHLMVMGDMNIAPEDIDIGIGEKNQKRWLKDGKCSFLPEEREWMTKLLSWGLKDTFRHHYPDKDDLYSWFDYRSRGFDDSPKRGLRIDLLLSSTALLDLSKDSGIDYEFRGLERPSDHCPVWADFNLELAGRE